MRTFKDSLIFCSCLSSCFSGVEDTPADHPTIFQSCWSKLSRKDCCQRISPAGCFNDLFTKRECCSNDGYALVDPLAGIEPPHNIADPWSAPHPAFSPTQIAWEARVKNSSFSFEITVPSYRHVKFGARSSDYQLKRIEMKAFKWDFQRAKIDAERGLEEDQYGLYHERLSLPHKIRVLDIGANIGGAAIPLAFFSPDVQIIAFEPNPVAFRYLLWNIRINGLENFIWPFTAGISPSTNPLVVVDSCPPPFKVGCWTSTATMRPQKEHARYSPAVMFPPHKLSQFFPRPTILKIDCECCEWDVFNSTVWTTLTRSVEHVVGEVHMLYREPTIFKSLRELAKLRKQNPRSFQRCATEAELAAG